MRPLADVQERALATRHDVDATVKGKRSNGSGLKGADVRNTCGRKAIGQEIAVDQEGGAEKGTKGGDD